jgi:Ca2+-dependent lipid-binding protein
VSDIQYKLLVRITLSLVDTVPCIGGATLSLLAPPHVDYKLRLAVRLGGGLLGVCGVCL